MSDITAPKKILLLAANPQGTTSLRLQEEEREIKERLRIGGYGKVPINSFSATRPKDIQQAILDFKPEIVHFSGHGAEQDGLVFEDINGQPKIITSEALANLFKLFANQIECVVLNACYSEFQAKAIARNINYVIGMNQSIGDRAAIEFAIGFYTALTAGESVEFAYKLGCNAIELEGIPEHLTPVLFEKQEFVKSITQTQSYQIGTESANINFRNILYLRISGTTYAYKMPEKLQMISIGRQRRKSNSSDNEGNDIVIRVPESKEKSLKISRKHFEIKYNNSQYLLTDKSGGRTKLNGQIIDGSKFYKLNSQDKLQIADVLELEILISTDITTSILDNIIEIDNLSQYNSGLIFEASVGDMVTVNETSLGDMITQKTDK